MLKKIFINSTILTFGMFLCFFLLNHFLTGNIWQGMVISKSALTVEYCEFNDTSKLFHQAMNTYSNLVYFFFGVFICLIAKEDFKNQNIKNRLQSFPLLSFLMGICFIYLSFGSAMFHASLTWVGQRFDMNGTYSISIALLVIGFYQVFHKIAFTKQTQSVIFFTLICLILAFYPIALLVSSSILLPVFILLIWLLITINYFQFRKERFIILAILSIISILVAFKIRTLDVQKVNCDPHSLYQGHSVWHLLAGLSSFCSYLFFRISKPLKKYSF